MREGPGAAREDEGGGGEGGGGEGRAEAEEPARDAQFEHSQRGPRPQEPQALMLPLPMPPMPQLPSAVDRLLTPRLPSSQLLMARLLKASVKGGNEADNGEHRVIL